MLLIWGFLARSGAPALRSPLAPCVAALAVALAGCSQTPTFDATGGASSAGPGATMSQGATGGGGHAASGTSAGGGPDTCTHCALDAGANACKALADACAASDSCMQIKGCVDGAPDNVVNCAAPHATGVVAYRDLANCLCDACPSCGQCPLLACIDGVQNNGETAIDCGGPNCPACAGNCSDGIKDNGEIGIDCGGPCPDKCAAGSACTGNTDCASGFCVDAVCCDGACGGVCEACSVARKGSGTDGACGPVAAATDPDNECISPDADRCNGDATHPACGCHDGVMNGDETAVDCGGSCPPCGGTCTDSIQDNGETDVDCGGPNCPGGCVGGKKCAQNTDCQSQSCHAGTCCVPDATGTTCAGKCGNVTNNCGVIVDCGGCTGGDTCGALAPNRCDCVDPSACSGRCGSFNDACGNPVDCGGCPGGTACHSDNTCQCDDPNACNGKCGVLTDACGRSVNCGNPCAAPTYCGGGGVNLCGCQDDGSACFNTCNADRTNNCGQGVHCGNSCGGGQTCYNQSCCNLQNNCQGGQCAGTASDGCGGQVSCSSACPGGQYCVGNFCCQPNPNPCGSQCAGQVNDGCGNLVNCDSSQCGGGDECSTSGTCCTPDYNICYEISLSCGDYDDGCGYPVYCDTCYQCGGYCNGSYCQCYY